MKTEFGNAKLYDGYYQITSSGEGNCGKLLHRFIYEKHYGEIPKGYVIHHIDGNSLNNDISNLKAMSHEEHSSLHHSGENHHLYGKHRSKEVKDKISKNLKGKCAGHKHPRAKYTLWDSNGVYYYKTVKAGNKAFTLKWNGKTVSIGAFLSFDTVECLHKLIEESI